MSHFDFKGSLGCEVSMWARWYEGSSYLQDGTQKKEFKSTSSKAIMSFHKSYQTINLG